MTRWKKRGFSTVNMQVLDETCRVGIRDKTQFIKKQKHSYTISGGIYDEHLLRISKNIISRLEQDGLMFQAVKRTQRPWTFFCFSVGRAAL